MANELLESPPLERFTSIIAAYKGNLRLYKDVEDKDTPIYWEAKEKLEDLDLSRLVVFGRDGKYFFTALKASDFGFKEKELKYVVITRLMDAPKLKDNVTEYLRQNGVALDFSFVDTGYRGSIPEMAIKYLSDAGGFELSREEIDKRIKLLSSHYEKREELSKKRILEHIRSSRIDSIEERPQNIKSPENFIIDRNGKLKPEARPFPATEQLKAWTVEHAIMRNFSPRLNPDKTINYIQKNPLEGCKFVEDYHGNYIGTHPLELWEYANGRKLLVKGGPHHTLRADFVGQKFLSAVGVFTPDSELINVDGELKLKMDFLEGFKEGGIELPKEYHNDEQIQAGLFVDALLGQYDRTPWNIMFDERGKVAFIDNGAGLFSRARGGA